MIIGLVGKPSVGKSTFFKACTLAEVDIASYPFTTIKPNSGVGYVKVECVEKEFNTKCNPRFGFCIDGIRYVPVQLIDVAGLIEGSYEGKGMGNQFLSDLNQADVLIHIVDASGSTNEKGEQVEKLSYNPCNDVKFLENELDMWYYGILKKGWDKFVKTISDNQNVKRVIAKQLSGLNVTEEIAEECIKKLKLLHHPTQWQDNDLKELARELRIKTKPMIIAANKIDVEGSLLNLHKLQEKFKEYIIIGCSADSEVALREAAKKGLIKYKPGDNNFYILEKSKLNEKQINALEYIKEDVLNKLGSTGIQEVLDTSVFKLLNYIAVFPGGISKLEDSEGRRLPDCFLLKNGSTALDFAFKIHTDLGNNFVKAMDVKKRMAVGKDHKLSHRDVIEIKTSK